VMAIGVDTHKASLAACAIDALGRSRAERTFANSAAGHRAFERWLRALPLPRRIGIEGSGSFGAALAQRLAAAGEDVREVPVILTHRERRRTGRPGKCDPADALAIARVVLREERLPLVRDPLAYRDLKLLVDYRDQLIAEQTRLRNRLHSDLQVLMPGYGAQLGRLGDLNTLPASPPRAACWHRSAALPSSSPNCAWLVSKRSLPRSLRASAASTPPLLVSIRRSRRSAASGW